MLRRETKSSWVNRIMFAVTCILMLALVCPNVYGAEESGESEYLDPITGESYDDDDSAEGEETLISDTCYYSFDDGLYHYHSASSDEDVFTSSTSPDMYAQSKVSLELASEDIEVSVYKSDKNKGTYDGTDIIDSGEYDIKYNDETLMSFIILGDKTNLEYITLPTRYTIDEVTCDDDDASFDGTEVDFTKEAQYKISYHCDDTDETGSLSVTTDYEAPTLALEAVNSAGVAWGPVDISDVEDGCTINVYRDDEMIDYTEELSDFGEYRILLMDEAGNYTQYEFKIAVYFNAASIAFFVLVILIIIGIIYYAKFSKKHIRVR